MPQVLWLVLGKKKNHAKEQPLKVGSLPYSAYFAPLREKNFFTQNMNQFRCGASAGSADIGNRQHLSAIQVSPLPVLKHQSKFRKFT
jgi:hypothetical protein